MNIPKILLMLVALLVIAGVGVQAQTFDLRFLEVLNDGAHFDLKIQIKSNVSTFGLGNANLVFTYTGAINSPSLLSAANFTSGLYSAITVTEPAPGRVSVNIDYGGGAGSGTIVTAAYMDVATVRFTTANPTGSASLTWRTRAETPNPTNAFKDDQTNEVSAAGLNGYSTGALPIQLASFTVVQMTGNQARLTWTTQSETNNYGFEVQKSLSATANFQTIPNSFLAGQGTTTKAHTYSFTDNAAGSGDWYYRLKQQDLDGTVHFSDAVKSVLAGVTERPLPTEYALNQNFPNPFNPSTVIEFALPRESAVRLEVYNAIGERVSTLISDVRQAGYYTYRFDGSSLASGIYFYRLATNEKAFLKKMMLVK